MPLHLIETRTSSRDRKILYDAAIELVDESTRRMCNCPHSTVFSNLSKKTLVSLLSSEIYDLPDSAGTVKVFYNRVLNILECLQYLSTIPAEKLSIIIEDEIPDLSRLMFAIQLIATQNWAQLELSFEEFKGKLRPLIIPTVIHQVAYQSFIVEFSEVIIRLETNSELFDYFDSFKHQILHLCLEYGLVDHMSLLLRHKCFISPDKSRKF